MAWLYFIELSAKGRFLKLFGNREKEKPHSFERGFFIWRARKDSNLRPHGSQTNSLFLLNYNINNLNGPHSKLIIFDARQNSLKFWCSPRNLFQYLICNCETTSYWLRTLAMVKVPCCSSVDRKQPLSIYFKSSRLFLKRPRLLLKLEELGP